MNLSEYKKSLTKSHKPRTVIFLIQDKQVLLGYKKSGFGKGNYVGIGGKVETNESVKEGAVREFKEEVKANIPIMNLEEAAVLRFYFPHISDESWNQEVHAFVVKSWNGKLVETDEIEPVWFSQNKLPLDKMWDDAKYWLPKILEGEKIYLDFLFDKDLNVTEYQPYLPT